LSANLPWFHEFGWDIVTAQNAVLCAAKNALHKPTSEGYEPTKQLWESNHQREMSLYDAVDLARRCHRMAPFYFIMAILLLQSWRWSFAESNFPLIALTSFAV
jgi:hypothetical protein